ncbi:polymorphic toxin type 43 domain-containing protein [Cohnella boryungensis]|uniref:Polymorphic toxin type 43 domain-containing protein n=1 Tax=Cohnella boryungensis TaxID=768479 RepID=A0ABV8SFR7_9BACL
MPRFKTTQGAGDIPTSKGSDPVPGVIGVNPSTKSVGVLKNYNLKAGGVEFVFDAKTITFVAGSPTSGLFQRLHSSKVSANNRR